jgi:hypothetical protein
MKSPLIPAKAGTQAGLRDQAWSAGRLNHEGHQEHQGRVAPTNRQRSQRLSARIARLRVLGVLGGSLQRPPRPQIAPQKHRKLRRQALSGRRAAPKLPTARQAKAAPTATPPGAPQASVSNPEQCQRPARRTPAPQVTRSRETESLSRSGAAAGLPQPPSPPLGHRRAPVPATQARGTSRGRVRRGQVRLGARSWRPRFVQRHRNRDALRWLWRTESPPPLRSSPRTRGPRQDFETKPGPPVA